VEDILAAHSDKDAAWHTWMERDRIQNDHIASMAAKYAIPIVEVDGTVPPIIIADKIQERFQA
jgi:hypothetical protein